jgi:hypothetical protein
MKLKDAGGVFNEIVDVRRSIKELQVIGSGTNDLTDKHRGAALERSLD